MQAAGKRYIVHGSTTDEFTIWNLSDLHLGTRACAEDKLREDIQTIADDPKAFWLATGDLCDHVGYRDKRFDATTLADWVKASDLADIGNVATRYAAKLLKPIAHKCLGLGVGNHEKKYEIDNHHASLHGWLCTELGTPNLEYSAIFDLVFVRKAGVKVPRLVTDRPGRDDTQSISFRVYTHHGAGAAGTPGGKINRLVQFMQSWDADIYFIGHVHDQVGRREPVLSADASCTKITHRDKLGVISGSYLKTYEQGVTTYGEIKGYRPVSLGAAWVKIKPDTREMRGQI